MDLPAPSSFRRSAYYAACRHALGEPPGADGQIDSRGLTVADKDHRARHRLAGFARRRLGTPVTGLTTAPPTRGPATPTTTAAPPATAASTPTAAPSTTVGSSAAAGFTGAQAPNTVTRLVDDYYTLVDQHRLSQSFRSLSPSYQQRIGFAYYRHFWNSIIRVDVLGVNPGANTAAVTLRYVEVNGTTSTENANVTITRDAATGRLLIDSYRVS